MKMNRGHRWIVAWLLTMPLCLWSQVSDFQGFLQAALRHDFNEALEIINRQSPEELTAVKWTAEESMFRLDSIQDSRVSLGIQAQNGMLKGQEILAARSGDTVGWALESAMTVLYFQATQREKLIPILSHALRVAQDQSPAWIWQQLSSAMLDEPPTSKSAWAEWLEAYQVLGYLLVQMPVIDPGLQLEADQRYRELRSFLAAHGRSCEMMLEEEQSRMRLGFVTPVEYVRLFLLTEAQDCPSFAFRDTVRRRVVRLAATPFLLMSVAESYLQEEMFWEAQKYLLQASAFESNPLYKSVIELRLAGLYAIRRSFRSAKLHARQAHELHPTWGRPWLFLADLVETSGVICAANERERWAVAYLAMEYCEKAVRLNPNLEEEVTGRINALHQIVPDPTELEFMGLRVGDRIPVTCWINETARVR